jgi:hypothetical protein
VPGQAQELELAFATASQAVADHGAAAEPGWPVALAASELIERLPRRKASSPSPAGRL